METKTFKQLEAEAVCDAAALRFRGVTLAPLYVAGATATPTKEQAIARALESEPEVYAAYRRQHNAAAMVRALQDAGYHAAVRRNRRNAG